MEGSGRSRAVLRIVALVAVLAVFQSCGPRERPIPPPPFAVGDSATVRQYLEYAASLSFATGDSTSAVTRHATGADTSVVRLSPERRLLNTPESVYATGRIIARIQTDGAVSPYNTPVGEAYLWVWRSPTGVRAQIITREPGLPDGGRILGVPTFFHVSLPDSIRNYTFCEVLDSMPAGACCRCPSGCWNTWATPQSEDYVVERVRRIIGG